MKTGVREPSANKRAVLWVISGIALLLLLLGAIAVATIDILHLHFGYAKAAKRYRDAGMPWTMADIKGEPLPAEKNAAPTIAKLALDPQMAKSVIFPQALGLWTRAQVAEAERDLATRAEILEALKGLQRLGCQWDTDLDMGGDISFPELAGIKSLVKALTLRMELRSAKGDLNGSLEDLRTGLDLASKTSEGRTLIHQLVCIALRAIICQGARRSASYHTESPAALDSFAEALSSSNSDPMMAQALKGEAYLSLATLRNKTAIQIWQEFNDASFMEDAPARPKLDPKKVVRNGDPRWWLNRSVAVPILTAWAEAGEIFAKEGEGNDAVVKVGKLLQKKADNAKGLSSKFVEILFPVFAQAGQANQKSLADVDSTIAALKLAALKARKGSVSPEEIKKLTPIDPFTGKPMGVKVTAKGVSVWSFGQDMQDDGGAVRSDSATLPVNAGKPLEGHRYDYCSQIPWQPTLSALKRAAASP